jgi:hypothetical protein
MQYLHSLDSKTPFTRSQDTLFRNCREEIECLTTRLIVESSTRRAPRFSVFEEDNRIDPKISFDLIEEFVELMNARRLSGSMSRMGFHRSLRGIRWNIHDLVKIVSPHIAVIRVIELVSKIDGRRCRELLRTFFRTHNRLSNLSSEELVKLRESVVRSSFRDRFALRRCGNALRNKGLNGVEFPPVELPRKRGRLTDRVCRHQLHEWMNQNHPFRVEREDLVAAPIHCNPNCPICTEYHKNLRIARAFHLV